MSKNRSKEGKMRICKYCKKEYIPDSSRQIYCSKECQKAATKLRAYKREKK